MHYPIKTFFVLFLTVRRSASRKAKTTDVSLSELIGYRIRAQSKNSALYQSQGVNLQNCVRLSRFSYWLLCNFSVKFAYQKFTNTCYDEGHCGRSILKNGNPSPGIFVWCLGNLPDPKPDVLFRALLCRILINSLHEATCKFKNPTDWANSKFAR